MDEFIHLLRKLRAPGGCPWDRAQTPRSLAPFFLEEAYELLEAITQKNECRIKEELGDILLHILFQSQMAEDRGAFVWEDVVRGITDKISSRHADILNATKDGDTTSNIAPKSWETAKLQEKGRKSILEGIPSALPALLRAWRCQQRAAEVGFDWPDAASVWDKVLEEKEELEEAVEGGDGERIVSELGDFLFAIVSYARHLGLVAEEVLHSGIVRFADRFGAMERLLVQRGMPVGKAHLEEMEQAWEDVKAKEGISKGD